MYRAVAEAVWDTRGEAEKGKRRDAGRKGQRKWERRRKASDVRARSSLMKAWERSFNWRQRKRLMRG